ncbi:MAG: SDR family NAD(P)-dependent oxidoreductase [Chlorobi bacterium]|nr:SDR family NAD(P)-dependent oxidoreductase [Chlorobiota bacterium]
MNILEILPAVRMLASKKGLVTCSLTDEKGEGSADEKTLVIESPDELRTAFKSWYESNDSAPESVVVSGVCTIAVDSAGDTGRQRIPGRIVIVTGGAQGFGAGIAEELFEEGANIVVADLNEEVGSEMAARLNAKNYSNKSFFVKTDVSDPDSVENLIKETTLRFGGLDVMISNAGILRAGGLDEMDPKTFDIMTKVNYTGYFYCAKYSSKVMKIQSQYSEGSHFMDIIQINSKSGLKGSNRNFAYAGGKFGGIGLTQSFALELMPHQIKVNSICPGNFFDGPLWSNPENGLFVQYLKAGKVPGAKTIEDVKQYYENQVPARRGCRVIDVVRAILYAIEQEYETGQAIPVTGGQEMLK